jgi:hypothetical protein
VPELAPVQGAEPAVVKKTKESKEPKESKEAA